MHDVHLLNRVDTTLPVLAPPLTLVAGPATIAVEHWSDGTYVAHLPSTGLYGTGSSEQSAVRELVEEIRVFYDQMEEFDRKKTFLGGALAMQWQSLQAIVKRVP